MAKRTMVWLLAAASLILVGGILFAGVMMTLNWDFSELTTSEFVTNEYVIDESYTHVYISTDIADIKIKPALDGITRVICYEQENQTHTVKEYLGDLYIQVNDERAWHEHIAINFKKPKIELYIPQGEYGDLFIRSDTGDIKIYDVSTFKRISIEAMTGDIDLGVHAKDNITATVRTGDVQLRDVSANRLYASTSTGDLVISKAYYGATIQAHCSTGKVKLQDITGGDKPVTIENQEYSFIQVAGSTGYTELENVVVQGEIRVNAFTGSVMFKNCDAAAISVEASTGHIKGNFLTPKVISASTNTGKVDVPESTEGGPCDIKTTTGSIKITFGEK